MFLVPTKLVPTALTRLFSIPTKCAWRLSCFTLRAPSGHDESVAALVERHFGQEAVDRLADPLLSGIYGGDAAAAQRANRAAAPGRYGNEVRLAHPRNAGGTPQDASSCKKLHQRIKPWSRRFSLRFAAECSSWSMPSLRSLDPACVRSATPVAAIEKTGERLERRGRRSAAGLRRASSWPSPAWAAGESACAGRPGARRRARQHSLLFIDHRQPHL